MRSVVSGATREQVAVRAGHNCEYCKIHEDDTFYGCHVDHVISVKHGGPTELDNLAFACVFCNRQKGSDIGSVDWETGEFVRFFNPRHDEWSAHFALQGATIHPLTAIGRVTERILQLNRPDRVIERTELVAERRYPPPEARGRGNRR